MCFNTPKFSRMKPLSASFGKEGLRFKMQPTKCFALFYFVFKNYSGAEKRENCTHNIGPKERPVPREPVER